MQIMRSVQALSKISKADLNVCIMIWIKELGEKSTFFHVCTVNREGLLHIYFMYTRFQPQSGTTTKSQTTTKLKRSLQHKHVSQLKIVSPATDAMNSGELKRPKRNKPFKRLK